MQGADGDPSSLGDAGGTKLQFHVPICPEPALHDRYAVMILLRRSLPSVRSLPPLHTRSYQLRCHSSGTIEAREPLRVLFCGSDEFSIASLRALHELHQQDRSIIASIDVVHKPGKRTGRGLKTIKEVPIRKVAEEELLLPTHVINTFTGWQVS